MTDTLMEPMSYQQVAIDKLSKVQARLVGDEMGVGKTVTGIGLDLAMRKDRGDLVGDLPTLIIPEKIGIDVWTYHLSAMGIPDSEVMAIDPTNRRALEEALVWEKEYQAGRRTDSPPYVYYIVHWDVISKVEILTERTPSGKSSVRFAHVIADEVHLAKNRKALRTKALKKIDTLEKTGLSGTPADDKPQDIWSVLNWLYPKKYKAYWRFFEKMVDYDTHPTMGYRIPKGPRLDNLADFHQEIAPFYIRRKLLDVVSDMPEKIHVEPPISVELTPKMRKAYKEMEDIRMTRLNSGDVLSAPQVVAQIIRLQQMTLGTVDFATPDLFPEEFDEDGDFDYDFPQLTIMAPSPKLDAIMNLIETNETESFIVFSQFKPFVDMVERECNRKSGMPAVKIHGGVKDKDRRSAIDQFMDGTARVFAGTIAAAGKTITLTKAQHVIFADRHWNPAKNRQAEARAWRFGQQNAVRIYDIVARDTIDERFVKKVKRNGRWVDKIEMGKNAKIAQKGDWIDMFLDGVGNV